MDTPLGDKNGTLEINALSGNVSGNLTILGKSNSLSGVIGTDGKCSFSGKFVTLLRVYPYFANGVITENCIKLVLATDRAVYNVLGYSREVS